MRSGGFTLIELSIVLVIIGLIVGGILVGQDLIKAAEVRAQISQIEKYNSAVNTFRAKFGALPGDMPVATANQYGFTVGSGCSGSGNGTRDGDGLIEGYPGEPIVQGEGETELFWQDLSSSAAGSLIEGNFPNSGGPAVACNTSSQAMTTTPGSTYIGDYLPAAKIGHGNFVAVYTYAGANWYTLGAVNAINTAGYMGATASIPVIQAYNMDKKTDDGLPTSGAVQAYYVNGTGSWPWVPAASANAAADSTSTCYNTTSNAYSVSSLANYGTGGNCGLSFRFQ